MRFPKWLKVYGDEKYRGKCPHEEVEQVSFFNWLRREYSPLGVIALHPRNEGKRSHEQTAKYKAEGMAPGASDIIIPANPAFVCEMKRQDHTKSHWQPNQLEYLEQAQAHGAFVCVALGYQGAKEAFNEWLNQAKS
jgi:hypothetical protein